MIKPTLLSGVQPSGHLTIGNYIGAIRQCVKWQSEYKCFFMLADLHSITVRQQPQMLKKQILDGLAMYLACGLDPKQSALFIQSQVPEHAQLAWLLICYTQMGELNRMTQFKDKSCKHPTNINIGLFSYPALMAADILLYKPSKVPVGEDQKQHLELTRTIAARFNNLYGVTFKLPELDIPKVGAKIMALQNPKQKMSKSDANANNYILMLDSPDIINKKITKAVTDSDNPARIYFDPQQKPGLTNLLTVLSAVTDSTVSSLISEYENKLYGRLKIDTAEAVINFLTPIQQRFYTITQDSALLTSVMRQGREQASAIAANTLATAYQAVGLITSE